MTNRTATPARQAIRRAADPAGWTFAPKGIRHDRYTRGQVVITVEFVQSTGAVREARRFDGTRSVVCPSRGKREAVLAWLAEAEAPVAPAADAANEAQAEAMRNEREEGAAAEVHGLRRTSAASDRAPEVRATVAEPVMDADADEDQDQDQDQAEPAADDAPSCVPPRPTTRMIDGEPFTEYPPVAQPARVVTAETAPTAYGDALAELERAWSRIAELEAALADEVAAHESTRRLNAELERRLADALAARRDAEDQADEDERIVVGLADTAHRLRARAENAERRLAQNSEAYAAARSRITDLEDAPVRKHARRLVEALVAMRDDDGVGPVRVSLPVSRAFGLLADTLGIDVTRSEHAEPEAAPEPASGVDEHPAGTARPAPPSAAAMLRVLGELGLAVRRGLPGERVAVRETHREHGQPLATARVLGFLRDGVLTTDEGREARVVQPEHVAAYLDHVRSLGHPGPTARRLAAECAESDATAG